jgi:uncharacterized damage-inducible protein DinB
LITTSMSVARLLQAETIRRLEEGLGRIHACSGMLSDDQVWHRPNSNVVSIGNLILHLAGNVGQWINATLGGRADDRHRDSEFNEQGPLVRVELMGLLDRTIQQAKITLDQMTPEDLVREYAVQGFRETGVAILIHVAEHFSYHVGQITLHTKLMLDIDTGYYEGQDLGRTGGE